MNEDRVATLTIGLSKTPRASVSIALFCALG
jgi:hypothetical protein